MEMTVSKVLREVVRLRPGALVSGFGVVVTPAPPLGGVGVGVGGFGVGLTPPIVVPVFTVVAVTPTGLGGADPGTCATDPSLAMTL